MHILLLINIKYIYVTVQRLFPTANHPPILRGTLTVVPNQEYLVKIEAMSSDMDSSSEYISSITMNGNNFGSCYAGKHDCTFYDCSIPKNGHSLHPTTIQSTSANIDIKLTYTSQVNLKLCYCNTTAGTCSKHQSESNTPLQYAAALVTLIPTGEIH